MSLKPLAHSFDSQLSTHHEPSIASATTRFIIHGNSSRRDFSSSDMVRKALFAAPEMEKNEKIRTTKRVAAVGMIDSLALLAGSPPEKPSCKASKQSMSSVLEQLSNLDLTQRPGDKKKDNKQFPNKTTTTLDACTQDLSIGNDTKARRRNKKILKEKNPAVKSDSQLLYLFAQENIESCRRKLTVRRRNTLPTHRPSGGILGTLEQPSISKETRKTVTDKLAKCGKSQDRVGRGNSVRPKHTSISVLEQATAMRRTASSPICSPSFSRYIKRSNQQRSPSPPTKAMEYSPCGEVPEISLPDASPQAPKSGPDTEVNTSFRAKALESAVPARSKQADVFGKSKRFDENSQATVVFNIPQPLSPDPVVDPEFLKRMEKTKAAHELMNRELELRECLSVSTCSLTEAIYWDEESENDSTMAVASPVCDDMPKASRRNPSESDLPTSPQPGSETNIQRKDYTDRTQIPVSTKKDLGVANETPEERTIESASCHSKRNNILPVADPEVPGGPEAQVSDMEPSTIKLRRILTHNGPLNESAKDWMGCAWNLQVKWSDRSITWEPLEALSKKYASKCMKYAEKNGLLETMDKDDEPDSAGLTRNEKNRTKGKAINVKHKRRTHKRSKGSKIPASTKHFPRRNRAPPVRYEPEQPRNKSLLEFRTDASEEDDSVNGCAIDERSEESEIPESTKHFSRRNRAPPVRYEPEQQRNKSLLKFQTDAPKEDEAVDGWTIQELSDLKKAHASANPLSSTFWEDIAKNVDGKTASDCCSRWMSLFPTPVPHKKSKKVKDSCSGMNRVEDDLFESTPWRGTEHAVLLPKGLDLGSGIKLDSSLRKCEKVANVDENEVDEADAWKPRDGMRRYIQEMGRNVKRPVKRKTTKLPGDIWTKGLREKIDMNGVNMDLRMSPGGTLNIKCNRDDNEDDLFDEYYGADEDEGEIYTQF